MTLAEEIAENIKMHVASLNVSGKPLTPYAVVAMTIDPRTHKPLSSPQPVCVPLPNGVDKDAAKLMRFSLLTRPTVMATVTGASDAHGNDMVFLVVQTADALNHHVLWTAPVEYPDGVHGILGDWQKTIETSTDTDVDRMMKAWELLGGGKEIH